MKRLLLFCSGANTDVLNECPTDASKYVGIGATILLTSILASLSGGYALFTVFRSVEAAVPFGLLWGVVIFNLDRVIVSGMRKQKNLGIDLLYAMPRLIFSVLLAIVISRPLELRLFEVEIQDRWEQMQIEARTRDMERIFAGDSARLVRLNAENKRLIEAVETERTAFNQAQDSLIGERAGTSGTGIPGPGSVYRERQSALEEAKRRMDEVEERNRPKLARNDSLIAQIGAEQTRRIGESDAVRSGANGFLARMRAFGELARESRTVRLASLIITLLFVSLETAPVVVKLLSTMNPYRPYDELLERREFELVEPVRQDMRVRRQMFKTDADRMLSDHDAVGDTEMQLSTKRHELRLNAELQANEALIQQISDAQMELAVSLVDEWKRSEMDKIKNGGGAYAQAVP
jgi:Domain of unknown function (DUF4407)